MQFKTFTYLFSCLLLLLGTSPLLGQVPPSGTAMLSGQQETLPVATAASGSVSVDFLRIGENEIDVVVTGSFENLSSAVDNGGSTGAHIHIGYPGRNGGVVIPLVPTLSEDGRSGTFEADENTFRVTNAEFAGVDTGEIYVNIHTLNYPAGEIRGILVSDEREVYFTNLLGSNEVPSVISTAHGALLLEFDAAENSLVVTGSYDALSDTLATSIGGGAHLHFGMAGMNGPVNIPLTATQDDDRTRGIFESEDNTFTLNADQVAALQEGRYYANIHSGTYPSGEIRGQVLPRADAILRAHLSGSNEWPVVTSGASGQVLGHLVGNTLLITGTFSDLGSAVNTTIAGGAHLHPAWAGANGPVAFPLTVDLADDSLSGSFLLADNSYALTDDQRTQLLDRGIYLNIHSKEYGSGEIRGQMLPESQAVFTAFLNGNQQIPSITTTGRGMVKVEMMGSRMTATGSFQGLMSDLNTAIAGGSHLHAGYPGQNGPVIYPLMATQSATDTSGRYLPMANTFTLSGGRADTLMDRFFYVNVHSMEYGGGEIRGSVLAEAESYFLAPLSGASEPQGVPTMATGMVAAEVTDTMVTLVGSFKDLESDFAANVAGGMHLHRAIAGSNGGILQAINTEIAENNRSGVILADSNRLQLPATALTAMMDREVYANIHTAEYSGGAIRGQMLPLAGSYFHATFSGANATNYVATTAQGGLKMELINSTLKVSGSVTMLNGDFDASIAGGAHLHLAPAGQNGGIVVPLNASPADDLKSVTFPIDSNTFELADSVIVALRTGRLYANVHTTIVPSGEARGQVLGELNLPPVASMILSPVDGDSLNLEGASTEEFRVTYMPATDPDMDTVIYIWQLSADEAFENVLFAANTGRDTFFTTDFGTVGTLLDSADVATDSTITLYHRVLASDGSNYSPSEPASVTLIRGNIVGTRDFLPEGFSARAYPNPAATGGTVTYEVNTQEAFRGRLLVFTQLGQLRQEITVNAQVGTQNYPLDLTGLPAGQYFVTLRNADGRLIHASRLLVQ